MTEPFEIPFALADQWDEMLRTKGKCATYWEIAQWGYQQAEGTCPHVVTSDEGTSYCALAEHIARAA